MKKLLTVFFIIISLDFIYAAENSIVNNNETSTQTDTGYFKTDKNNALGLTASSVSGMGFNYWHAFTSDFRTQITGIWIYTSEKVSGSSGDHGYETTNYYDAGLELQWDVFDLTSRSAKYKLRTYFFTGGAYWYEKDENEVDPSLNDEDEYYTAGIGIGLEQLFFNTVSINLQVGYQYEESLIDKKERGTSLAGGIGAAIHF